MKHLYAFCHKEKCTFWPLECGAFLWMSQMDYCVVVALTVSGRGSLHPENRYKKQLSWIHETLLSMSERGHNYRIVVVHTQQLTSYSCACMQISSCSAARARMQACVLTSWSAYQLLSADTAKVNTSIPAHLTSLHHSLLVTRWASLVSIWVICGSHWWDILGMNGEAACTLAIM